jgi:hypothetical protein
VDLWKYGGEGEIRTPGALSGSSAFEAGAFNHSATSPRRHNGRRCSLFSVAKVAKRVMLGAGLELLSLTLQRSPLAKEVLHQVHTARCQHTAYDLDMMIELGVIDDLQYGVDRPSLRIFGPINQPADPGVGDGAGAHRAWFNRDVQVAIEQAIVADGLAGFAQRQDLGVRRGIMSADGTVAAAADDAAVEDDNGAHRHFAQRKRAARFPQSFFHPELVRFGHKEGVSCGP